MYLMHVKCMWDTDVNSLNISCDIKLIQIVYIYANDTVHSLFSKTDFFICIIHEKNIEILMYLYQNK
jgi:hypothetical protein